MERRRGFTGSQVQMLNFSELGRFYSNLATMDDAGLTYLNVFESFKKTEKDPDQIYKIQFMISHLTKNRPLVEGLRYAKYVPVFDIPLIKAAEDSGRLVEVFRILSKKYNEAADSEKQVRGGLIQPGITLIVALFVPSFPDLFLQKITLAAYLKNSLGWLVVIAGGFYGFYYAWMRSFYDLKMAQSLFQVLSYIPFMRGLNQKIALEKFVTGLAMMLDSGMDLFESLNQSARCASDPKIAAAVAQFIPMIKSGVDIAKVFQTEKHFPHELVNAIGLGADSGKLPEFLRVYGQRLNEEINSKIKVLTKVIPVLIYIGVTFYIAYRVVRMYTGHLDEAMKVIGD